MLFLALMILTFLWLSTVSAQESPALLPPVTVRGVPLPSGAIPDRLRTQEQAQQEIERTRAKLNRVAATAHLPAVG